MENKEMEVEGRWVDGGREGIEIIKKNWTNWKRVYNRQCFIQAPFFFGGGSFPPKHRNSPPPRIFGLACREAKNNVNTRLASLIKCLMFKFY